MLRVTCLLSFNWDKGRTFTLLLTSPNFLFLSIVRSTLSFHQLFVGDLLRYGSSTSTSSKVLSRRWGAKAYSEVVWLEHLDRFWSNEEFLFREKSSEEFTISDPCRSSKYPCTEGLVLNSEKPGVDRDYKVLPDSDIFRSWLMVPKMPAFIFSFIM